MAAGSNAEPVAIVSGSAPTIPLQDRTLERQDPHLADCRRGPRRLCLAPPTGMLDPKGGVFRGGESPRRTRNRQGANRCFRNRFREKLVSRSIFRLSDAGPGRTGFCPCRIVHAVPPEHRRRCDCRHGTGYLPFRLDSIAYTDRAVQEMRSGIPTRAPRHGSMNCGGNTICRCPTYCCPIC